MIPAYIIDKERQHKEEEHQIQLEIPDYTLEYEEYLKRKQQENPIEQNETVIIIDIY